MCSSSFYKSMKFLKKYDKVLGSKQIIEDKNIEIKHINNAKFTVIKQI